VRFAEIIAGFAVFLFAMLAALLAVGTLWFALGDILSRMGIMMLRFDLGRTGMPVSGAIPK